MKSGRTAKCAADVKVCQTSSETVMRPRWSHCDPRASRPRRSAIEFVAELAGTGCGRIASVALSGFGCVVSGVDDFCSSNTAPSDGFSHSKKSHGFSFRDFGQEKNFLPWFWLCLRTVRLVVERSHIHRGLENGCVIFQDKCVSGDGESDVAFDDDVALSLLLCSASLLLCS